MKRFIIFFLLLFFIPQALGLGVSGRVIIPFEPGLVYEGEICILPDHISNLRVYPRGELADRIDIDVGEVVMEEPGCFPYTVKLPQEFETPGIHKSEITVTEIAPESQDAQIVALVTISHQIWVEVPYPGKYLVSSLNTRNTEEGEEVPFTINVQSKGEDVISFVRGTIEIFDFNNEKVGQINTNMVTDLENGAKAELEASWDSTGQPVGDYWAEALVEYDGGESESEGEFKIGSLEVRLVDYTKEVYKKGIVPFRINVESYWSKPLGNVKAHVGIYRNNTLVSEFDTLTKPKLPAWESIRLDGFLDTTDMELANHTLKMIVEYISEGEALSQEHDGYLVVAEKPEPKVESPGLTDYLNTYLNSTKALLITTIILALIALVVAYRVFKDRKQEKQVFP